MKRIITQVILISLGITALGNVTSDDIVTDLIKAAKERTLHDVTYDGSYFSIAYPNGDVPPNIGVCTDVVIRSYRKVGVDLQLKVHEDITENFDSYPSKKIWGLKGARQEY